jgi:F-type H+-transporting ATPase subunit b
LFRPINRILEDRERQTRGRISEAQAMLARVKEKLSLYEKSLREARAEGYSLLEQQRAGALLEREVKVASIKEEIAAWAGEEKAGINSQAEEVRRTLESESRKTALEIGARILRRPLNEPISVDSGGA